MPNGIFQTGMLVSIVLNRNVIHKDFKAYIVDAWPLLIDFLGWAMLYSLETWEILHQLTRKLKNSVTNLHDVDNQIMKKVA